MKGKLYIKPNNKLVVRWENGDNLLTGKPYEWEAELLDQDSVDRSTIKNGEEVEFLMTDKFKVNLITNK